MDKIKKDRITDRKIFFLRSKTDREKMNRILDNVFWLGGSPCSGKSSIAERIVKEHNFEYYKCDDYLYKYVETGCKNNIPIMKKINSMSFDQTWLERDIREQVEDEIDFYLEAFSMIKQDLFKMNCTKKVLVEGAAILPHIIKSHKIDYRKYVCIVPTREFQINKYSKREWVEDYLSHCSNPKKAFCNWMERDSRYAKIIANYALNENMKVIIEDGSRSIIHRYNDVSEYLGLKSKVAVLR